MLQVDCVTLCADTPAASEVKLTAAFQRADALQPCVLLLRNLQLPLRPRGGAEEDGRVLAALCHLLSSAPSRSSYSDGLLQSTDSNEFLIKCF